MATLTITLGGVAAAVALAPRAAAPAPAALSFLLFAGSSPHVASTAWFYVVPEVRGHMRTHQARYLWWPLALIAGACAIAALVPRAVLSWLLLPYFGWQFFHYGKQNLGLAALAASARAIRPLRFAERRALTLSGLAGIAGLLARPGLLQLPVRSVAPAAFPAAAAGGPGHSRRCFELAALGNIALLGGAALSVASDQLTSGPGLRALYGVFLGAVMAHFVIDAGLWRMRDEFPRLFLRSRLPYLIPAAGVRV